MRQNPYLAGERLITLYKHLAVQSANDIRSASHSRHLYHQAINFDQNIYPYLNDRAIHSMLSCPLIAYSMQLDINICLRFSKIYKRPPFISQCKRKKCIYAKAMKNP